MRPPLPSYTSSVECVRALRRLGFHVDGVNDTVVRLVSPSGRHLFLPRHRMMRAPELFVLLLMGGVSATEYLHASGRLSSGEFPRTHPEGSAPGALTLGGFELRAPDASKGRHPK